MDNELKFPKRTCLITAALLILAVVAHQFFPRGVFFLAQIQKDDVVRIECTVMPDESVDVISFSIKKADWISQIIDRVDDIKMRPKLPLEMPESINRDITLTFYDAQDKALGKIILDRPKTLSIAAGERTYVVYDTQLLTELAGVLMEMAPQMR